MATVICLFNHKGGVSKTTTTFNLGWMIATKEKRVMLVDCDPQCNLTGMVLGYKKLEDLQAIVGNQEPKNIRDGLSPAFESRPTPIQAVECLAVPGNDNLMLLPGHVGLAEYEVTLAIAQELSGSVVTLRNLPGSLRHLIDVTAAANNIDYVFIDLSPSLGPVNQNVLMTSDFFLVPMHPDYFSTMGIESLATILPKWRKWAESAREYRVLIEADYPLPKLSPKFMGSIIQRYRLQKGKVPAQAFQKWIDELERGLRERLLPALAKADMLLPPNVYAAVGFEPEQPLLQMSDFNSLIARSQEHQVPVFALTDEQLDQQGVVLQTTKSSMEKFRELFSQAANRVIGIVDHAARA
ncbi:MAG: AAA family ATPase [Candidatus Tectomicrobia bacterium]|nr:AAA family ATPase [Candidatus Tectomicrobia bacterium]